MPEEKLQYDIEFLYEDSGQMFSSGALLTESEKSNVEAVLNHYAERGIIAHPSIHLPTVVPQSCEQILAEVIAAAEDGLPIPRQLHECQNCEQLWPESLLNEVEDLSMRVAPGEPMPSGECPACGAVCHPKAVSEPSPSTD